MRYFEEHRPVYHFSCKKGWLNDPNGLIYYNGYFHLFYQHYPGGVTHGPMHWGHARSRNLLDWEELPIALYPDENGMIFSGSIVYDRDNTGKFGNGKKETLVAVFTHDQICRGEKIQYQSLAYSTDGGMSFKKYAGNPVLDFGLSDFRDPKVFWYAREEKWIMLTAALNKILIFSSRDLREWEKESAFSTEDMQKNEIWECPDLCVLKDGEGRKKWVLIVSQNTLDYAKTGIRYFIGDFDGNHFVDETGGDRLWMDFGRDNYAAATFEETKDRIVQLGWMNCWAYAQKVPEEGFRGSMTIPRELFLLETPNGTRVGQKPAREIFDNIHIQRLTENKVVQDVLNGIFEIEPQGDRGEIFIKNEYETLSVSFDYKKGWISVDRSGLCCNLGDEFAELRKMRFWMKEDRKILLVVDTTSIEIFAAGGEAVGTFQFFPERPFQTLEVRMEE